MFRIVCLDSLASVHGRMQRWRVVTSMFCIKKQFEHLSLFIVARFYLLLLLLLFFFSRTRFSYLVFFSVPPTTAARSAHVMVKPNEHTQRTQSQRDSFTQLIGSGWFEHLRWSYSLSVSLSEFCWSMQKPRKITSLLSLTWNLTARSWNYCKTSSSSSLRRALLDILFLSTKRWWKTGLNQLRENPTKKRHRKHKKISVSC